MSGQASGPASILVNGAELAAAVKSLPQGKKVTAEITISDDALVIECDGTESVIAGMGEEAESEYPAAAGHAGTVRLRWTVRLFARSVARVSACAGTDDTLPVLMCVKITSDHGSLEFAATDRYRLGVDTLHWTGPDGVNATVPAVTLAKFAAKADKYGKIALHFAEGFAGFSDGVYSLITHTHYGRVPEVQEPHPHRVTARWSRPTLRSSRRRSSGPGSIGERNTRTGFTVTEAGITVTADVDGKVAASQVIPATIDGPEFDTGFNAGYLASVLAGFSGPVSVGLKMNRSHRTR